MGDNIARPDWGTGGQEVTPVAPSVPAGYDGPTTLEETDAYARMTGSAPVSRRGSLPAKVAAEWNTDPAGFDHRLRTAQEAARGVLDALPPEDSAVFTASFDRLPEGAQAGVFRSLALGGGGFAKPASDATLAAFAATPEGAVLTQEWRGRSARNLGRVAARMQFTLDLMDASDRQAVQAWFDNLTVDESVAVIRALAA